MTANMLKFKSNIFFFTSWLGMTVITQSMNNAIALLIWSFFLLLTPLNNLKCVIASVLVLLPVSFLVH